MKKTIASALVLVALMTACSQTETIAPRPTRTDSPTITTQTPVPTAGNEEVPLPAGHRQPDTDNTITPATVGEPTPAQPVGRAGAANELPAPAAAGNPARAVMPADTLAMLR